MQTDYERYIKMSSLAQIGWWEADFAAGHYLCSDFLCDLLGFCLLYTSDAADE